MTPEQIELVQKSFKLVAVETTGETFYNRLFDISPNLRSLFQSDMTLQGHRLMTMIGMAVDGLTNVAFFVPLLRDLGRRHAGYGVLPVHYAIVGAALIWTLQEKLGEEFTPEIKEAWQEVYRVVSQTMMEGGYDDPGSAARG